MVVQIWLGSTVMSTFVGPGRFWQALSKKCLYNLSALTWLDHVNNSTGKQVNFFLATFDIDLETAKALDIGLELPF